MKQLNSWQCEYCGKVYDYEKLASKCEDSHNYKFKIGDIVVRKDNPDIRFVVIENREIGNSSTEVQCLGSLKVNGGNKWVYKNISVAERDLELGYSNRRIEENMTILESILNDLGAKFTIERCDTHEYYNIIVEYKANRYHQ